MNKKYFILVLSLFLLIPVVAAPFEYIFAPGTSKNEVVEYLLNNNWSISNFNDNTIKAVPGKNETFFDISVSYVFFSFNYNNDGLSTVMITSSELQPVEELYKKAMKFLVNHNCYIDDFTSEIAEDGITNNIVIAYTDNARLQIVTFTKDGFGSIGYIATYYEE